jgi:hypothetical protein
MGPDPQPPPAHDLFPAEWKGETLAWYLSIHYHISQTTETPPG